MTTKKRRERKKRLSLSEKALFALKDAVFGVIKHHEKTGLPLATWCDGKVVMISAKEALQEWKKNPKEFREVERRYQTHREERKNESFVY